ncbi:4-hydroxyphenylacetate 3-hydroxylase N-terminal domain-containing protein, partial [Gordonia rhizosphera]
MAMMTRDDYLASLDDGRRIFAEGEEVKELAKHPQFATAIALVGDGYEQNYVPGDDVSGPYFQIP